MAPALVYVAVWSVITIINVYRRGADASPLLELKYVKEPQDKVVLKGKKLVSLECSALSGTKLANITWLKDGHVVTNSKRFQFSPTGELLLRKFARRHIGKYQCIASNDAGKIISKQASVVAASIGKIKQEPKSRSPIIGDDVRFSCIVDGKPLPEIEWQKNQQRLPINSRYSILKSSALHIANVNPSDVGNYRCVARNIAGNVSSSEAALTVNTSQGTNHEPISIQSQSFNITKEQGSTAVFECFASGRPKPTITWLKDGTALRDDGVDVIITKNNSLILKYVRYRYTGKYSCRASTNSPKASITKDSYLRVTVPPILEETPENISGRPKSSTVRFTCLFRGYPEPKVKWFQNGKELQETPGGRVKFHQQTTTMVISQIELSDAGYIQCWGINEAGITSAIMSLSIVPPQESAPDPPDALIARSLSSTVMEVSWSPAPPKNGLGSMGYSVHYVPVEGGPELQKVVQEPPVRLEYLKPATNYSFYVMAYNEQGASDHSTRVYQVTPGTSTPIPVDLIVRIQDVQVLNATAVSVSWVLNSGEHSNIGLVGYVVRYREDLSNTLQASLGVEFPDTAEEKTIRVKTTSTIIVDLKPYTLYLIDVKAEIKSKEGSEFGPYSEAVQCTMLEGIPTPPLELQIKWIEPESLSLSWNTPQHHNGILRYFVIYYTTDQDLPLVQWNTITKNGSVREAVVSGLQRHKIYYFKMAAATRIGEGETTPVYTIQTTTSSKGPLWFSDKEKGILVGVAIGGTCIIICVIIIVLRNRCSQSTPNSSINSNGQVPNLNGGPPGSLVHHVDGSFHEMDSFTPMLSPHIPFNRDCDTKGGYDTYPRIERAHFLKGLNGFSGGRTRTVSSGYTSDRDLDHIDEGIHVHTQSEGEPTDPISMDVAHLEDLEENHSSHGIDSFSSNSNTQRGSWPSHCGSASGSQDSNKDSGTGTECLGGGPSSSSTNGDHMGSCHTLTGCNITRSSSSPGGPSSRGDVDHREDCHSSVHHQSSLIPNSTSVAATNKSLSSLSNHKHTIQGGHSSSGINRVKQQQQPNCNNTNMHSSPEMKAPPSQRNCVKNLPPVRSNSQPGSMSNCTHRNYPAFCNVELEENAAVIANDLGVHSQGKLLPQDVVVVQEDNSTSLPLLGTHKDFSRTGVS